MPLISLLSPFLVIGGGVYASGEEIYLKNGRTIWADHVAREGTRVTYEVGDDSYAISATLVDHVDARPTAPPPVSSEAKRDVPAFAPADNFRSPYEVTDKIIHGDRVDQDALAQIEKQGQAEKTAAARRP